MKFDYEIFSVMANQEKEPREQKEHREWHGDSKNDDFSRGRGRGRGGRGGYNK